MSRKRATIIYNPMSGRPGRRADDVRRMAGMLERCGIDVEAHPTRGHEDATHLAAVASAAAVDIIVSYGGDGTLNEVVQGIATSQTALAVWPGGTANVVARDLGVPSSIEQLAEMIAAGKTKRIALGLAAGAGGCGLGVGKEGSEDGHTNSPDPPRTPSPQPLRRYFLMMAGIGLDASIARGVNAKLKRRTGEFAYWMSGIRHLFTWSGEPFTIDVDGERCQSTFALIGNGKGYGGGMMITPGARLEEPWFEIYVLPPLRNNFGYLRALAACMRGKPEAAGAKLVRGRNIKANSAHAPWVEADGEIIGTLPMTFEIVPDALSVIVP